MHSAGARALREDDNEMSREAVLLQWERKIEVAERLEDDSSDIAQPVPLPATGAATHTGRFERRDSGSSAPAPAAERRTITITGQPTPARRRPAVLDSQL